MLIAFSFLNFEKRSEHENFMLTIFQKISALHPEHTFLFIADKTFDSPAFPKNVIPVELDIKSQKPIKWLIRYHVKIRALLKKYKADVLISNQLCSLITKVPQILIAPDLSFLQSSKKSDKKSRNFYKRFTPRFLKKAETIIALSEFEKKELSSYFKIDQDKIEKIYEGSDDVELVSADEREIIKEKYADGNEYFIYSGIISPQKNLKNLLKGFSGFKKRQRSGMQLIIAGNPGKEFEEFEKTLELYKFKKEIKLLNGLSQSEIIKLTGSSYAMVYPCDFEMSATSLLTAMKCEVPLLASSTGAIPEFCGDAALYFNPADQKDIAEKMMEIFRDEKLRRELIDKGTLQSQKYDWEKSADRLWQMSNRDGASQT